MGILAVLLGVLALLFTINRHPVFGKIFKVIPLLVFAYFVPTILSNTGVIPLESPLYGFIMDWLLPASLILLTLAVDVKAIMNLGKNTVILFLVGTVTIVLGGPIALLAFGWMAPADLGVEVWKGLAALSGSWIGGGANFIAIGKSVGVLDSTLSMMVVVDVAVANVWMAALLFFAGRNKEMDEKIGADREAIEKVRTRVEDFHKEVERPTNLADLLLIVTIGMGGTAIAHALSQVLPEIGNIVSQFTWVVVFVTTLGLIISFTPWRKLEGAGASSIGSLFLYLLVATIGAKAEFAKVVEVPGLVVIGAVWLSIHAGLILFTRWKLKAPIFFAAVGSQANVGGAASAPIVASAFHPALAPVGVLLGIGGYVVGTYAGLVCAFLLEQAYLFIH
ncbi:MAG: DUF819 family protein [Candidatus Marinimicrobia bacterium]|nr:DUF819 family protein [Candidatus Neomarinimicrobiota bacterium]MCF7829937.1 DUF819 family protein [Candidatus Neomarinimicrobiota bacterium]MCF7881909.1 DUF819 family protein [Candidatus Neomarinimicrobiota bacterium]